MSYEADLARFAQRLAGMISEPQVINAADLPIADAARLAVRRWCRQVLAALAGDVARPAHPGISDLATNPVGTLRALLDADPVPIGTIDPRDVPFDHAVANDGGQLWKQLRVDAVVTVHQWSVATPESRPTGDARWSAIADVAAIVEAAAILDRDLVRMHPPRAEGIATLSRDTDLWNTATAAEHVRHLAQHGPLPSPEPLRNARLLPLRVQRLSAIGPALERLNELLAEAAHLRPKTISALAGAHWRTLLAVADAVDASQGVRRRGALADQLREQAAILRRLQPAARELVSLSHDDPRPLRQANQIRLALQQTPRDPQRADAALTIAAPSALRVTSGLRDATGREVSAGRWYQRTQPGSVLWATTNHTTDLPVYTTANRAAQHAERVLSRLPETPTAEADATAPRAILTADLLHRDRERPYARPSL